MLVGPLNGLDDADARGRFDETGDFAAHTDRGDLCKTGHSCLSYPRCAWLARHEGMNDTENV